jgi:zinc/manganese transport system substrate-binding protein
VHPLLRLAVPLALAPLAAGCGASTPEAAPTETQLEASSATTVAEARLPTVVVTYSVLASVVSDLVGDAARVVTIIPDGTDPHAYEPSAKDVEAITTAAVVVSNGLGYEEGLETVLDTTEASGVPVFHVADHVTVRGLAEGDHGDDGTEEAAEEDGDHHGSDDPHLWLSPATLAEAVPAMATAIGAAIGVDLSGAAAEVRTALDALDAEIAALVATLEECELVTGHDELGYFADRYGCEVIGAVIPSLTTTAEATAKDIAELRETLRTHGVAAVFTGLGTPPEVAAQVASDAGATLVELRTHALGETTTYADFLLTLARTLVDALD